MDFVSWKDRKGLATALKEVYRATDADTAEKALTAFEASPWGSRYPAIGQSWRRAWTEVIPFFAFPDEVRRIIYTTNAIEGKRRFQATSIVDCDVRYSQGSSSSSWLLRCPLTILVMTSVR